MSRESRECMLGGCLLFSTLCCTILTFLYTADVSCYMPANGETTTIFTNPSIPVDISLGLLKRETAIGDTFFSTRN